MTHIVCDQTYVPGKTTKGSTYEDTMPHCFVEPGVRSATGKYDAQFTTDVER